MPINRYACMISNNMRQYEKHISKKGLPTYKYNNRFIYSAYDPVKEADKFIRSQPDLKKYIITCCGADYINSALLQTDITLIISYDPLDFNNTLQSEKLIRIKNVEEIEQVLLKNNIHAKDVGLLLWKPLIESNPEVYLEPLKALKQILHKAGISSNTANTFGFLESSNFIKNYLSMSEPDMLIKNETPIPGPAVIISSGASLEDAVDYIKQIESRCYFFALPSALPFLASHEIKPDFVIAVDPGYGTYYHLAKYPHPCYLLCPLTVSPSIFKLSNFKPLVFSYATHLDTLFFTDDTIVTTGAEGTVFINLLRILPQLGFNKALVFGQDFGYYNHRSHVPGGTFEREFLHRSNYFHSQEAGVKFLEKGQPAEYLHVDGLQITTNTAYKLYYEHFIKQTFQVEIVLPETCFNPIAPYIKKISSLYIVENFKPKSPAEDIILKKRLNKNPQTNDIMKKLLHDAGGDKLFYNKDNASHKRKLTKLRKGIS